MLGGRWSELRELRENERDEKGEHTTQNRWHSWPCPVRLLVASFFLLLRAAFYITVATYNLAKWGEGLNNTIYSRCTSCKHVASRVVHWHDRCDSCRLSRQRLEVSSVGRSRAFRAQRVSHRYTSKGVILVVALVECRTRTKSYRLFGERNWIGRLFAMAVAILSDIARQTADLDVVMSGFHFQHSTRNFPTMRHRDYPHTIPDLLTYHL